MCRKLPFVARGSCAMTSSYSCSIRAYVGRFLKATAPRPSYATCDALFRFRWRGPWASRAIGHLEGCDLVDIALGQSDVVPTVEQARAADRIDGEVEASIAAFDRLLLKIDGQGLAPLLPEQAHERCRLIVWDDRSQ